MNAPLVSSTFSSLDEGRAHVESLTREEKLADSPSGYVQVGNDHFHVARIESGSLVSLVQWKTLPNQAGVKAALNPFVVNENQKQLALQAWNSPNIGPNASSDATRQRMFR